MDELVVSGVVDTSETRLMRRASCHCSLAERGVRLTNMVYWSIENKEQGECHWEVYIVKKKETRTQLKLSRKPFHGNVVW